MVQKTRVFKTRTNYNGERSPYWDWINLRIKAGRLKPADSVWEPVEANPDLLPEDAAVVPRTTEETEDMAELIREAIQMAGLSPQELRAVEFLSEGITFRQAAKKMNISTSTFSNFMRRARKKIVKYVGQNS